MTQLECIVEAVIRTKRLHPDAIYSKHRFGHYVYARHLIWWFSYVLFGITMVELARQWKVDHSSVSYGIQKINDLLSISESGLKDDLINLMQNYISVMLETETLCVSA